MCACPNCGCKYTHEVAEDDLELVILLPPLPNAGLTLTVRRDTGSATFFSHDDLIAEIDHERCPVMNSMRARILALTPHSGVAIPPGQKQRLRPKRNPTCPLCVDR